MDKILELYTYTGEGVQATPFPNTDNPIEIGAFRYDAKRMGGAPTITASVNYPSCLDEEWSDNVYAKFNGEKYYLKQTPTSSYDNQGAMYKHELELVSERVVLDNVYFFDAVVGNPQGEDKPVSNSTKVVFFGGIREFARRMNASLEYSKLLKWEDGTDEEGNPIKIANGYNIVVDNNDDITTEEKLMSFEDQFFSNVLQEIYNVFEVPYYFVGKTIHIGYANESVPAPTFAYGVDDALLSITKNNANFKVVNRATATGSSENIPFYYPNNSAKGDIEAVESEDSQLGVKIVDYELFANKVEIDGVLTYQAKEATITKVTDDFGTQVPSGGSSGVSQFGYQGSISKYKMYVSSSVNGSAHITLAPVINVQRFDNSEDETGVSATGTSTIRIYLGGKQVGWAEVGSEGHTFEVPLPRGNSILEVTHTFVPNYTSTGNIFKGSVALSWSTDTLVGWYYNDERVELKGLGLTITNQSPYTGSTITQKLIRYIKPAQNLMPSIYRESGGDERFYNATNNTYEGITFNNPFTEGRPKEHIFTVEDIKPTIKEAVNSMGLRMDMFSEFAYDEDDNDELVENEEGSEHEYVHSYFFGKLRKLDFNLFEHAIENQPMTISFTSGDCGACNFEIGVTEEFPQKNPVQVNADGTLKRDSKGRVICGQFEDITEDQIQDRQQDTINNEVWIALKKEDTTYGILMPKAPKYKKDANGNIVYDDNGKAVIEEVGHRPKACTEGQNDGDTFAVIGINLPKSYITNAEKKVEAEIIKYLKDNNDEKFTFSINFSRIYFEENPDVLKYLSENSRINVTYNGKTYLLFVTSFSYSIGEGDVLPEIRVELDESLTVTQNALQNAISQVKSEVGNAINSIDVIGIATPHFIRKDADDETRGRVNFKKGVKFGEGGKVEVMDNNSTKLTIEYLEVTKKATFTSLEIQEKTHAGGQILVTPAAITCGEVEELEDAYRCYFQTKGVDGDEIFNQFVVGDQAICQTFNAWGSKYYWRLVTGIGEDYIDLSKTDCDEYSDSPSAGDKIIQLGNQVDAERQNAIVIAAYGDGSPYIIQYKGINSFEIGDDKIVTKLSSTENIFTGKVHMEMGSDGLGDLQEFVDLQTLAGKANTNATNAQNKANTAMSVADRAQQSADTANTNALQAGESASAATEKAEEAIGKAEAAKDGLDNMEIGGENLLRNSGFTGDYLSEQLADEKVLEGAAELYSSPFDHWDIDQGITRIELANIAQSGYGVSFASTGGTLRQDLSYKIIANESYTLSFSAKGSQSVDFRIGSSTGVVSIKEEWVKYEVTITSTSTSNAFSLISTSATLCDIKLEKGNKSTSWSASPLDNASDRAYYQSMKYIQNAFDGATDISGGLVLTEQIWVGDYDTDNKKWVKMNGGMSGVYESDHDVAFWAGGNINQAIETVMMYEDNPTLQPTEEQLASMAKFVVTHGGKAILNDIILRGIVYAKSGVFSGFIQKTPTVINPSNYHKYLLPNGDPMWFDLDLSKAGTFVIFEGEWDDNPHFYMPQLSTSYTDHDANDIPHGWKYYTLPRGYSVNDVFALIGQKVIIMNNTNLNVQICTSSCSWIEPSQMAIYECEAKIEDGLVIEGKKNWSVNWTRQQHDIPDLTTVHPI